MDTPDSIIIEQVNHSFGKRQVLYDINMHMPAGQIFGLLGPSGCGKTTLVKIIAGILRPARGRVCVLGQVMPRLDIMARIGYMAQSDALYTTLSAEENLLFFAALYGICGAAAKKRIREVMEVVNLGGELKKTVGAYSGGMKRRLSLALALLASPPLLLLDEPTVGIDPLLRQDIWRELHALAAAGTAILVTTHVMDEAEKCHRLAMMREGRLIAQGSVEELVAGSGQSTIEQAFIHFGGDSLCG
jgi:ABC-2 type transport system ATP-binding protein